MATGWQPYDATKLAPLGYGLPNVITNVELEQMAARGQITRPSDGKQAKRVLFLQCAGSREQDHLAYCSSVCCMTTLKQAEYIREQDSQAEVFVIYRDIVTPGPYEKYYRKVQDHPLNFFMKGKVTQVAAAADDRVQVSLDSELLGAPMQVTVDLVVLATGMVPNSADGPGIRALRDANAKLARNESETQCKDAQATIDQMKRHEGTEILNLNYRQGPDLPVLQGGFADSKFVCFPYESMRTGIYAAGTVRAPMDAALTRRRRRRRGDEGHSVRRAGQPRPGGASAHAAISPTPASSCNAARNANAAPRSARSVRSTKTRRARRNSTLPLPALRNLHGRLSGTDRFLQELLGGHDRQHGEGD